MDSNLIGFIGIAVGLFLGLIGIALAVLFGLRGFRTEITNELSPIKEKVIIIQERVQNVWDVVKRSRIFQSTGTVERNLENLGKIRIAAEPQANQTNYFIEAEKPVILDAERVISLSEPTGLNQKERELFDGQLAHASDLLPHQLKLEVPSTDPQLCAQYMSFFLKWLDTAYYLSLPKVEDFEEPIQT